MSNAKTLLMNDGDGSLDSASAPDESKVVVESRILTFPSPAPLQGVKSRAKDVLKMMDVGVKLPTSSKLDIARVSVTLSQSSRVALLGAGALEKALFLKVVKGQLRPTEGTHMMVQGLCIAHLTPSLLKELEPFGQQTPAEYVLSRLQSTHKVTEPLTRENVAQHLLDFGLDQQAGICQLGKSARAKVVLAEVMWPKPQILIFDEFDDCFEQHDIPGLIAAIKKFTGGVLVVSSNETFYDAVATEKWNMNKGSLHVELDPSRQSEQEVMPVILECGARLLNDSTLNTSESISASKATSAAVHSKEKEYIKGQILEIEQKLNDAKTSPLTDSEAWEMFDKTESLKNILLFGANAVEVLAGRVLSRVVGVKLTLRSRVAAVGEEGRSIAELLLGHRKPKLFKPQRHEGLTVVHLGPHLAGAPFASAELAMAAVASELRQKQPQVVIIDEARHSGEEVWAETFSILLGSETVKAFRGAVVFYVAEETLAIRSVCSQRWTGDAGWLWQENVESDDFEILEDVAADDGKVFHALLEQVRDLSEQYFSEDSVEKAKSRGWVMSLLTLPTRDGGKSLAGFICYRLPSPLKAELHIARLAVPKFSQKAGCGLRLMRYILTKASRMSQSECEWISLSSLDTAVPFYENFGFTDMTAGDLEDPDHFQTWMELKNVSVVSEG